MSEELVKLRESIKKSKTVIEKVKELATPEGETPSETEQTEKGEPNQTKEPRPNGSPEPGS